MQAVDGDTDFRLGYSLSLLNTTLVVGAPGSRSAASLFSGGVYVWNLKNGTWDYTQKMSPSFGVDDEVGTSVSLAGKIHKFFILENTFVARNLLTLASIDGLFFNSGNYVLVGAPQNDRLGSNAGTAYIFQREQGSDTFSQMGEIASPTPAVSALYGWSVAAREDGLLGEVVPL